MPDVTNQRGDHRDVGVGDRDIGPAPIRGECPLDAGAGWTALNVWRRLGILRHPVFPLLERVWALRDNVSAFDASYIALAEALDCDLLTADARLSRAPGVECSITVVPR